MARGRFFEAEGSKSVTIENCEFENTAGIKFSSIHASGASIVVRRNRVRNVVRDSSQGLRQFVQLAEVTSAAVEISWNEVVNEPGKSEVEDVISIFKSHGVNVHDNYFKGGYPLVNGADYSGAGLTIEQLSSQQPRPPQPVRRRSGRWDRRWARQPRGVQHDRSGRETRRRVGVPERQPRPRRRGTLAASQGGETTVPSATGLAMSTAPATKQYVVPGCPVRRLCAEHVDARFDHDRDENS